MLKKGFSNSVSGPMVFMLVLQTQTRNALPGSWEAAGSAQFCLFHLKLSNRFRPRKPGEVAV
uniref:Uncharacterized protein n=1 Tax=Anguilla anguilla TaxID=7936 RepID=A0A0E9WKQ3_ANGAN